MKTPASSKTHVPGAKSSQSRLATTVRYEQDFGGEHDKESQPSDLSRCAPESNLNGACPSHGRLVVLDKDEEDSDDHDNVDDDLSLHEKEDHKDFEPEVSHFLLTIELFDTVEC